MESKKIAVISGSLRKDSFNQKIAKQLIKMAPSSLEMEFVEVGDLPLYNEDLDEANTPDTWVKFREKMKTMNGVLFATPEYNRSMPASIKNALDVGSRPYGSSVWDGLAGGVVSGSVSGIGGFGANHHIRQSAVFLNILMMQQPEAYIPFIQNIFDENGDVKTEETKAVFQKFIDSFAKWVEKNGR